jgi:hypothetical protein
MRRRALYALALLVALSLTGRGLGFSAGLLPLAGASSMCAPATVANDNDCDGLSDPLEQALAERFAPAIYIEPDESNYPVNVDWMLQHDVLAYHEDCGHGVLGGDVNEPVPFFWDGISGDSPTMIDNQARLLQQQEGAPLWAHPASWGADHPARHCDEDNPQHGPIAVTAPDPDGEGATGFSDQATFFLPDLPPYFPGLTDNLRLGSTDPAAWATYFHAYPTQDGGVMIQYWHVFAYNGLSAAGFFQHGGDWDASIQVQLDHNLQPETIWFSRHGDDHPGTPYAVSPTGEGLTAPASSPTFVQGTHPLVMIDGGGHAAYASPDDYCAARSIISTASWPVSLQNPLDPAQLQEVVCGALTDPVHWVFGGRTGGIVWQTWDGAGHSTPDGPWKSASDDVRSTPAQLTHPLVSATSAHGPLLNLGEYNPCTATVCVGSQQASTLLAGQAHPLNDQVFIEYSGRWGSTGDSADGPRGPVFQGFTDDFCLAYGPPIAIPLPPFQALSCTAKAAGHTYSAWYNRGAATPIASGATEWTTPPTSTLTIGSPHYGAPGAVYVSGETTFSLSATASATATQVGATQLRYRSYRTGAPAPSYQPYTGPFTLAGADGAYTIDFAAVDALGNEESPQTTQVLLVTTPPTTAAHVAGPTTRGTDGATYVASTTTVVLTTDTQRTPGLPQATEYRFNQPGSAAPAFQPYTGPFAITGLDGAYVVEFRSTDALGNQEAIQQLSLHLLTTPPTTTATLAGLAYTSGGVTYAAEDARVTLGVTQPAPLSPPQTLYLIAPAGSTATGDFASYRTPLALPAPDGAYTVEYYSVDALGNQEAPRSLTMTRDTTPPVIQLAQPASGAQYLHSATLTLAYTVADGQGAGVQRVSVTLDGQSTLEGQPLPSGRAINLLTEVPLGLHTLQVVATDNLGHTTTQVHVFTVIVTSASIMADITQFRQAGSITNAGEANALLATLQAAARSADRGDCATAANQYHAFSDKVTAQSGKGLAAQAATILLADADYLIANCR